MALLQSANLDFSGMVHTRSGAGVDPTSQAVLKTFQDFHASWFPANDFNELPYDDPNYDIYDIGEMALHLSHALFDPNAHYAETVTATHSYEALRRSSRPPEYTVYGVTLSQKASDVSRYDSHHFATGISTPWTPTLVQFGSMEGLRVIPSRRDVLSHTSFARAVDLDIHQPLGGGVLGTIPFLLLNMGRFEGEHADDGLIMPRRLSKAVLRDMLCRELPVVRATDAVPWVEPSSSLAFRSSHTCMRCHFSMDGMAGLLRHVELARTAPGPGDFSYFITKHLIANARVPGSNAFADQTPSGRFYYRTNAGELIDRRFDSLQDFGAFLAEQDDLYTCAAKRYYTFFLGKDLGLYDIGDPSQAEASEEYLIHRQRIVALGAALRADQSLSALVRRILSLPAYASSAYEDEP